MLQVFSAFGLLLYCTETFLSCSSTSVDINARDEEGMTALDWAESWDALRQCEATSTVVSRLKGITSRDITEMQNLAVLRLTPTPTV